MRELDWRIHELMGNDLTGWEWDGLQMNAVRFESADHAHFIHVKPIPHYSSTWEGAGLVMEDGKRQGFELSLYHYEAMSDWLYSARFQKPESASEYMMNAEGPLALAKAYISAMEERNNG